MSAQYREQIYKQFLECLPVGDPGRAQAVVVHHLDRTQPLQCSNPMQMSNATPLKHQIQVLSALAGELPSQLTSFNAVRKIAKSIADTEKFQLAADPNPDEIRTKRPITTKDEIAGGLISDSLDLVLRNGSRQRRKIRT